MHVACFTYPLLCVCAHVVCVYMWCVCVCVRVLLFAQPPSRCIARHVGHLLSASRVLLRIISLFSLPSFFIQPASPYRFMGLCPIPASLLAVSFAFLSTPLVFMKVVPILIVRKAQVVSLVRMPSALPPDCQLRDSWFPLLPFVLSLPGIFLQR